MESKLFSPIEARFGYCHLLVVIEINEYRELLGVVDWRWERLRTSTMEK